MAVDDFGGFNDTPGSPSRAPFTITPDDSNELPFVPKAIYVGTGGNIVLRGAKGAGDVTFKNVADGQVLDVSPLFIRATGTTAADMIGLR